jgi:hypothetical protein
LRNLYYQRCTFDPRSYIPASHLGHDVKSLGLNFATTLLFLLPFALYFDDGGGRGKLYAGLVVAFLALAVILPPFGWMRPHPYSDLPGNKPLLFRKDD